MFWNVCNITPLRKDTAPLQQLNLQELECFIQMNQHLALSWEHEAEQLLSFNHELGNNINAWSRESTFHSRLQLSTSCGLGCVAACSWILALQYIWPQLVNCSCSLEQQSNMQRKLDTCINSGHQALLPPLSDRNQARMCCQQSSLKLLHLVIEYLTQCMFIYCCKFFHCLQVFPPSCDQLFNLCRITFTAVDLKQVANVVSTRKIAQNSKYSLKLLFILKGGRYFSFSLDFTAGNCTAILKLALYNLNAAMMILLQLSERSGNSFLRPTRGTAVQMVSRANVALLFASLFAGGIIYFVHHNQKSDRKVRREVEPLCAGGTTLVVSSLVPRPLSRDQVVS